MTTSRLPLLALHAAEHEIPRTSIGIAAVEIGGRVAALHRKLHAPVEALVHRPLRMAGVETTRLIANVVATVRNVTRMKRSPCWMTIAFRPVSSVAKFGSCYKTRRHCAKRMV
jgi:hypothetical protein